MTLLEAIAARHSVRHYTEQPIDTENVERLQHLVDECNALSGLNIQLVTGEPRAFGESLLARYGKFSGVTCYFAMIGKKGNMLDETVGYYGERLVLEAQTMGLNTCWVGLSYKKISSALSVNDGEKLVCLISLGYGTTQGMDHKRKSPEKVSTTLVTTAPQWYRDGIEAALLAPTAINQQKFKFTLHDGNLVSVKAGFGPYSKVDLGIVKYHFELGAGTQNFTWKQPSITTV